MAEFERIDPKKFKQAGVVTKNERPVNFKNDPEFGQILGADGKPLVTGNTDPNVIGPDDSIPNLADPSNQIQGSLRNRNLYGSYYPEELFLAEKHWCLPFCVYVAEHMIKAVELIDELHYNKIQRQLKDQMVFCVMDLSQIHIDDERIAWEGFKIIAKHTIIVGVNFVIRRRERDPAKRIGISHLRVWQSKTQGYALINAGPEGLITREQASNAIATYFQRENITFGLL